jgi:hypothetical protein
MKLKPIALGLACGIVWGIGLALVTIVALTRSTGEVLSKLAGYYPGYSVSPVGALVGAVWGFVDGFIAAAVLAWLYNHFAKE